MKIDDIGIYVGKPDFEYTPIRRLEAKVEAVSNFAPAPTEDQGNAKLRSMAAKIGANAVIDVQYNTGVSMTSWRSMKITGLAVVKVSDEIACPQCAETIKRAAKQCRFCGHEISAEERKPVLAASAATSAGNAEPLYETNNPILPYVLATIAIVVLFLIVLASSA
jgi:uncharacterized Zn-binding protein involved in type VI secretion